MNFTPSSFYNKYLKGNEMTDFVERYIEYEDMDFMPIVENDEDDEDDEDDEVTYVKVYLWYKVRDIGDNDIIEQALRRCETLPWGNKCGCLFIGMTCYGISYEIFKEFCKAIGTDLSEDNKIRKDGMIEELTDNKIDKQIKELQEQNKELQEQNKELVEELSIMKSFTSHLVNRFDEQDKRFTRLNNKYIEKLFEVEKITRDLRKLKVSSEEN